MPDTSHPERPLTGLASGCAGTVGRVVVTALAAKVAGVEGERDHRGQQALGNHRWGHAENRRTDAAAKRTADEREQDAFRHELTNGAPASA